MRDTLAIKIILGCCLCLVGGARAEDLIDISQDLKGLVETHQVPALSVAVIVEGKLVAQGAYGVRKAGSYPSVTTKDKFHLGSCTKAMTATLAAIVVRDGNITWETTVEEVFDGIQIHEDYRGATLQQLLSNTGGCPDEVEGELWKTLWKANGAARQQRMQLVVGTLGDAPVYKPGKGYEYSNSGFSIAGAMLEKVCSKPFETVMREKLFKPLSMTTAGFRAPARNRKIDQPYGHNPEPVDPEPAGDNPRGIAPACSVHCSLADWAKFAQLHLGVTEKERLVEPLLTKEELQHLQAVVSKDNYYAMGWGVGYPHWSQGKVLTHLGSNTMFYSSISLEPESQFGILIVTNIGGEAGLAVCEAAKKQLLEKYREEKR